MPVHVERLAALARHLETLQKTPPKKRARRFDIGTWYKRTKSCGTAACAMGEACFVPELRKAGLRLKTEKDCGLLPTFKKHNGMEAAMELFGLSWDEASNLFLSLKYPTGRAVNWDAVTPGMVARAIRKFIAAVRRAQKIAVAA